MVPTYTFFSVDGFSERNKWSSVYFFCSTCFWVCENCCSFVTIFSSLFFSNHKQKNRAALKNFTGIAATLRFPVHDEEFEDDEDENDFDFSDEEGGPRTPLAAS